MGRLITFLLSIFLCGQISHAQQDTLKYLDLLQLSDTIRFGQIYQGLYGSTGEVFKNRKMKVKNLMKKYKILDSIPQHNLYLYADGSPTGEGVRNFMISRQSGDTAWVSGFESYHPASFQRFSVVKEGKTPILVLDYSEYSQNPSGSTELSISAFFTLDGFSVPLTSVVRRLWQNTNGSYEPACKDFQFYSVEFSRDVSVKQGFLQLGEGVYKYSSNMNCKKSSVTQNIPGGEFVIKDFLVVRKP